jgi:multiple sugar transport system substrate-binding protein
MQTRRTLLQQAGSAALLATTSPWWMVPRSAHAARDKKLVVWHIAALAPQIDKIMEDQLHDYAKQAGIKESDIDFTVLGSAAGRSKIVASLEAGNPPDIYRFGSGLVQLYRSQGHLLDVTDLLTKLNTYEGGMFQSSIDIASYEGTAYGIPQSVSPWTRISRMDLLNAAKVQPPKTWEEFVEVCKKLQKPPRLTGFGMCLGLQSDADNNIMNVIWGYGGRLIEADNKTVVLNSAGTVAGVKFIADMYQKHKIIPKGATGWDNTGNNKAYQTGQVLFVLNPTSIYAHLAESDKELYNNTGLNPIPAGPAGTFSELTTSEWMLFKHNPYPELAKGLVEYWMTPKNYQVVIEEGDGRWGPVYKDMYQSDFWKRPALQHWRGMIDNGLFFPAPGAINAASGEVLATNVMSRMMHRVLIESWEAEKAVEEAHNKVVKIYERHNQR